MRIVGRFKGYFLRGLAVLLPSILTIWIFVWGYNFIQQNISVHINRGLVRLIVLVAEKHIDMTFEEAKAYLRATKPELAEGEMELRAKLPEVRRAAKIRKLERTWVNGHGSIAGFVVAVIAVGMLGAILASVVGKTLWRTVERFMTGTPILRKVYPYVKQVTDFLLAHEQNDKMPFSRVVAVEYPRKGIWSLGLVTGSGIRRVVESNRREFLTVLIPTSPTPFTGFVIMVPRKQTMDLDLTIEEAFRFLISGGVIAPGADHGFEGAAGTDSATELQ